METDSASTFSGRSIPPGGVPHTGLPIWFGSRIPYFSYQRTGVTPSLEVRFSRHT